MSSVTCVFYVYKLCNDGEEEVIFSPSFTFERSLMASKPRLYARSRIRKTNSSNTSSSSKPDVLVLLDNNADSKLIIQYLSKTPILCQVIVLSDVHALDQYYRSYDSNNDDDRWVYLVKSDSFDQQIYELAAANDNFYSICTSSYTLISGSRCKVLDEEFRYFRDDEQLAKSVRDDLNSLLTLSDVELSSQSVSIRTPCFAWFQFMFSLLSHLERSEIGMEEVKDQLRHRYQRMPKTIEEFLQTYTPDKAIDWCMKDSFYFGHINRILRSRDIQEIFTHRTLIRDLEQCLISWHSDQELVWDVLLPMYVYRGQKTSKQELEFWQSNIGSIITMNSFISTSMEKNIAVCFTETFDNDDNDDQETLFTIWLDNASAPKAIFAYLYHADCEPDDQEILFSLRTLFRIDEVENNEWDSQWSIKLTVVDDTYQDVQQVLTPWKSSIFKENLFSSRSLDNSLIYIRKLSANNDAFLQFQLTLDIILRLERNQFAREEMLFICRRKFVHDQLILSTIDRFELTYQSECDAARWYTADSFLYRLLNDVLRTEIVDSIFKFRYFIQDLHNQLARMQIDYFKELTNTNNSSFKLYRGQPMTWNDFEEKFRANQGNLISINSFLSTTTDRYVARAFAGDGDEQLAENEISVLYEITIDTRFDHSVPFAELNDQTNFEYENEVLFSIGAVFRIEEICQEHRKLWTVKLTLTTDENEQWNILTEHLQEVEETSVVDEKAEDIVHENRTSTERRRRRRRRCRSFDAYRCSESDRRRSTYREPIRTRIHRLFEHPAFRTNYKEI